MDEDHLISFYSNQNFNHLEIGELRIIKLIAESGFLNLSEIGKFTSKYTMGFDRWGVKDRIEGSSQFQGLIPRDYVQKFKINEKESQYCLTVKGIFAALQVTTFEKIFLIQRYSDFLKRYTKNKKELELILNCIKYEIIFLLYNNYLQGIDWTRFLYLKSYLENHREYSGYPNGRLKLDLDSETTLKNDKVYKYFGKKYSNFHWLCFYSIGHKEPAYIWNKLIVRQDTKPSLKSKIISTVTLAIFVSHWFRYIDSKKLGMKMSDLIDTYLIFNEVDPLHFWAQSLLGKKKMDEILGSVG